MAVGAAAQTQTNVTTPSPGGTTNAVPYFSGPYTLGSSPITISGSNVGIGTTLPTVPLVVAVPTAFSTAASFQYALPGQAIANKMILDKAALVQIIGGEPGGNSFGLLGIIQPAEQNGGAADLTFAASRATTAQINSGTFSALQHNDLLGMIDFGGDNGAGLRPSAAEITAGATAAWSATSNSTSMSFSTTAQGSTTALPRMNISDAGSVGIGTTAPLALFSVGPSSQFQVSPTGTIVTSGGLTISGGTVSLPLASVANSALQNGGSLTVTAGAGLIGGGPVALGGTTSVTLPNIGTAGTYGSATQIPVITTDAYGRVTGVTNTSVSAAGGSTSTANTWTAPQTFSGGVGIGTTSSLAAPLDVSGYMHVGGNTIPTTTAQGAYLNWNALTGGTGETDFINNPGAGSGGFAFMNVPPSGSPSSTAMFISGVGSVGIGTTNPARKLEIAGDVQIDGNLYFGTNGQAQSGPYAGCGADYAESVDVTGDRTKYEPGDVLVIDPKTPGQFLKSNEPYSTLAAGIYSTKPGYVGRLRDADDPASANEIPMAMLGRVPTKVTAENGPIQVGDLLVTSSAVGYAMKGTDRTRLTGAVIGKALGSLDSGTGTIEVLVTLQ